MPDVFLVFSWVATTLFTLSLVPQAIRTFRRRRADDVSILFLIQVIVASVCMIVYAASLDNWVLASGFVANIVVWGYVLVVRVARPPHEP